MLNDLRTRKCVSGIKQSRRALKNGSALTVFLARDADPALIYPLKALCNANCVPVCDSFTMREIGQAAGIQVGAAVATLLKD